MPLHKIPNKSKLMVKKDVIEKAKLSLYRSSYSIKLIPEVFTFLEVYRHTLRPKKKDTKLQLDEDKVDSIIDSSMQHFDDNQDRSAVKCNFRNHISWLNTFFENLKKK